VQQDFSLFQPDDSAKVYNHGTAALIVPPVRQAKVGRHIASIVVQLH
jgi:hypothetical protein